jgi:Mn2+/Fe2+ NRAMP family transporter
MITSNKKKMGTFANGKILTLLSYAIATIIAGLNIWLLVMSVLSW